MSKVPNGIYTAIPHAVDREDGATFAQLGLSKRKKSKQVMVMFQITEGEYKGAVLPWFGYFTKDSAARTVDALRLCGFSGQDIFDVENQQLNEIVNVTVENNEFDGKIQSRVAWVNDPDYVPTITITPLVSKDKDALRAALKGIL